VPAIQEHVHIHATAAEVFARLAATDAYSDWLPRSFRNVRADGDGFVCVLALPGRGELVRLAPSRVEEPHILQFEASDGARGLDRLTFILNDEGAREVHLVADAAYTAPGGFPGALLDGVLHRHHRRQALRDALWRLKQLAEDATRA
jgi:uncharacterized protein YndB with AHSA1/START domain